MDVRYCSNSTLREVFAGVVGLPGPLLKDEFSAIRGRVNREWPGAEFRSVRALLQDGLAPGAPESSVPPGWFGQISWDEAKWIGRWGHRLTLLHHLVPDGQRYTKFSTTMRPTLTQWLGMMRDAYDFLGSEPAAASVLFCYINHFDLELGDLSEWFRFNFAVEAAGSSGGLSALTAAARIARPDVSSKATVQVDATSSDERMTVVVHTLIERDLPPDSTFARTADLADQIDAARRVAKETFFSFVTQQTMDYMGATDAEPEA